MYRDHTVAVVVPAYNEEGFVGEVIDTVPEFVDRVYAVDDRSTDATWDEIRRHASRETHPADEVAPGGRSVAAGAVEGARTDGSGVETGSDVVPIRHEENRGVGAAITTGYRRSLQDGIDVTAVMAGDGQMDPDQLDRLLDPIVEGRAHYAKGNRLLGREYYEEMSAFRLFGNVTLSVLTKISSGYWEMLDPQNGYTAISAEALDTIDIDGLYDGYGFCNDLLVTLNVHGFRVADVHMQAIYGDETSSIRYRSFIPRLSMLLLSDFIWRLQSTYLRADFHPLVFLYGLGGSGGVVGAIGAAYAIARGRRRADGILGAVTVLLLSAFLLVLAMVLDMQQNEHLDRRLGETRRGDQRRERR